MEKIKKFYNKNSKKITNLCFVLLFVLFFILVVLNEYNIQLFFNGFNKLYSKDLQVYFLDVGQASSTLVILPTGKTLIIDTGSTASEADFLESVDAILAKNKLKEIDMLVLTHSDEDHVGGAVALLDAYQVNLIFRPKILSTSPADIADPEMKSVESSIYERVITAAYLEPDCIVRFIEDELYLENECLIEFFACKQNTYGKDDTNSFSPFITITYKGKVFMLCGDATKQREEELLESLKEQNRTLDVDFLLVAHHGSKSSSTEEFLSYIKPDYAFISAGDERHPSQAVLDRLASCGARAIYVTKTDGMIGVAVLSSGAFMIKNMGQRVDLPLFVCIIFVIAVVWKKYLLVTKRRRKFSY